MNKFQRILHGFKRLKLQRNDMLQDINTPNSYNLSGESALCYKYFAISEGLKVFFFNPFIRKRNHSDQLVCPNNLKVRNTGSLFCMKGVKDLERGLSVNLQISQEERSSSVPACQRQSPR